MRRRHCKTVECVLTGVMEVDYADVDMLITLNSYDPRTTVDRRQLTGDDAV